MLHNTSGNSIFVFEKVGNTIEVIQIAFLIINIQYAEPSIFQFQARYYICEVCEKRVSG